MLECVERDDPLERVLDEWKTMDVGDHICVAENGGFDFNDIVESFSRAARAQMQYQAGRALD